MRGDVDAEREQAQLLGEFSDALATTPAADAPDLLAPELAATARRLHAELVDGPTPAFVKRLRDRIESAPVGRGARGSRRIRIWRRRPARWALVAPAAAALLLIAFGIGNALLGGGGQPASADQILDRARATVDSPASAGIHSLVATQRATLYSLAGEPGSPTDVFDSRLWYEAPDRQRIEFSRVYPDSGDGAFPGGGSVLLWDGTDVWSYDEAENGVHVVRQDPAVDVYEQGVIRGGSPGALPDDLYASTCRAASTVGRDEVIGRASHIIEVSRPRCGLPLPGSDGRTRLWVDDATGLILRADTYAVDGRLFARREVTSLEVNGAVDAGRLSYIPPPGAEVRDDRTQPVGIGTAFRIEQPPLISLDEARRDATFDVLAPTFVPAGFALEAVQHYWGNDLAKELRSHADWVLLRYADPDGNWLVITQGYGGLLAGMASIAAPDAKQGTVEVNGREAQWVNGSPLHQWLGPEVMRLLSWQISTVQHVALASNILSVDDLVLVADSLE